MFVLMGLVGLLVGWLLNWTSTWLPTLATTEEIEASFAPPPIATWRFMQGIWGQQSKDDAKWQTLHLAIEGLTAAFFMATTVFVGFSAEMLVLMGGFVFFLLIAIIDLKYRLILNVVTYPAIVVLVLVNLLLIQDHTKSVLVGGMLAFSIFFLTAWLKPGDLGMGDVKLAAIIGLTFGFPQVLWALIVGAGFGGIVAVYLLLNSQVEHKIYIPYAPFLCLGAIMALLYNPIVYNF